MLLRSKRKISCRLWRTPDFALDTHAELMFLTSKAHLEVELFAPVKTQAGEVEEVLALCVIWSLYQANWLEFKQTAEVLPAVS